MEEMQDTEVNAPQSRLLNIGMEGFSRLQTSFAETRDALSELSEIVEAPLQRRITTLEKALDQYSASVSLVGQVKSGKTTLTNVLAGRPGLLPSDVNPWTCVVTTLHLNKTSEDGSKANFRFFSEEEWDRLVVGGGRLGEMANRCGVDSEIDTIKEQVEALKAKTKARLGKNFELLLGQKHKYDYFDSALLERYICLGEQETEAETLNKQGRFADMTSAAELYLDVPQYIAPVTLRDTPGVNDPFLIREQMSIRSIRGAEICVVVLSAHQALTTMDMSLIRIISNLGGRQVILFINRIDELNDIDQQVPEIRDSIEQTLQQHNVALHAPIIFGSAKWAEAALSETYRDLPNSSKEALFKWAEASEIYVVEDAIAHIWHLSGVPALLEAIADRAVEGKGRRVIDKVLRQARNLANQTRATTQVYHDRSTAPTEVTCSSDEIREQVQRVEREFMDEITALAKSLQSSLVLRMRRAEQEFIQKTTESLLKMLNTYGEVGTWECDPIQLRMRLKAAYTAFSQALKRDGSVVFERAATAIEGIYAQALQGRLDRFHIQPQQRPQVEPPVILARTIVLDLNHGWWSQWWRARRGYENYVEDYQRLITEEVQTVSNDLNTENVTPVLEATREALQEFFAEQKETLLRIADAQETAPDELQSSPTQQPPGRLEEVLASIETLATTQLGELS